MSNEVARSGQEGQADAGRVRRRHVLYLSGFDPQGPAHYHALYRDEAARQAAVSGYRLQVGARRRVGPNAAWSLQWQAADDAPQVQTCYEFLRWDDIVRAHWPRGTARLVLTTLRTTATLVANGSLWRILQTSWPACLALSLPALLLLGTAAAACVLLLLAGWAASQAGALGSALSAGAAGVGILLIGGWALARGASATQAKVQTAWLMRSASVILRQARGDLPVLEDRLDGFARRLRELLDEPSLDEVLVVGHSSGAMLAVSVVARAIQKGPPLVPAQWQRLALLTLGQCIPVLSYQPQATEFRRELQTLRGSGRLQWVDFTSPPDGCCFALTDPTAVCDDGAPMAQRRNDLGPKRLSPRFAQAFGAAAWRRLRRDKYRCHFQYLMAVERSGHVYDYFALTAGDRRLADRVQAVRGVQQYRRFECFGGPRR